MRVAGRLVTDRVKSRGRFAGSGLHMMCVTELRDGRIYTGIQESHKRERVNKIKKEN